MVREPNTWDWIAAWYDRHPEHDWITGGSGQDAAAGIMLGMSVSMRHPEWAAAMLEMDHAEYGCDCGSWLNCPSGTTEAHSLVSECPVTAEHE